MFTKVTRVKSNSAEASGEKHQPLSPLLPPTVPTHCQVWLCTLGAGLPAATAPTPRPVTACGVHVLCPLPRALWPMRLPLLSLCPPAIPALGIFGILHVVTAGSF